MPVAPPTHTSDDNQKCSQTTSCMSPKGKKYSLLRTTTLGHKISEASPALKKKNSFLSDLEAQYLLILFLQVISNLSSYQAFWMGLTTQRVNSSPCVQKLIFENHILSLQFCFLLSKTKDERQED